MNFDLTDLRAFVAVADLGSFRAAAEALHLTQPALSRRVDKLEQALAFRLFDRTTRKVEINAMGRSFLPRARHVLDELDRALLGMTDLSDRLRGQVTVACVPSAVSAFVADALQAFRRQFPRIGVRIVDDGATHVLQAVTRSDADFGITYLGTREPDLEFEPLFDEAFVLACRRDHPLARRRRVSWSELAAHDCMMPAPGSGNRILIDQALAGLPARVAQAGSVEVRHVPALLSLVEAGIGVGVMPRFAVPAGLPGGIVSVPLVEPEITRTIGTIRRRARPLAPAAQAFHDLLRKPMEAGRSRKLPRPTGGSR